MLRAIFNKSWRQHPTRHQLYGHLPLITKTIQVRRARHAGHCWRSRDELIRDVLLWTPTHGRAKAVRPARTYIQQLCEDTGCCPEDLPRVMNDREEWRERVRDIRATSAIWWWWLLQSLVSRSFLVCLRHSFLVFLSFLLFWCCSLLIFPSTCSFPFLLVLWFFLYFRVQFTPLFFFPRFSLLKLHIFLNSIALFRLYILIICIRDSNSDTFLTNRLMSSMYIRCLIFSCDLMNL